MDRELTASKLFLDKRSFCNLLGQRFLAGQDMAVMHDAVMARDKWRCVEGGETDNLQVHHIIERSEGGSDDMENLKTLCAYHHSKQHGREVQWSRKVS